MTGKVYGDFFYGSCYEYNALFKMNLTSGEMFFINHFTDQERFRKALYRDSIKVDDIIYFLPDTATGIAIYDVKNNNIETITLPTKKERICNGYNGILINDEKILMVPLSFEEDFYLFDIKSKKYEVAEKISNSIRQILVNYKDCLCLKVMQIKDTIVLPIAGTNVIIEIICENGTYNLKKISSEMIISGLVKCKNGYMTISSDGKKYVKYLNGTITEAREIYGDLNRYWAIQNDEEDNTIFLDRVNKKLLLYADSFTNYVCENVSQIEWDYISNSCFFRSTDCNGTELIYSINMNGIIICKNCSNVFVKMYIPNLYELEQYLSKSMQENILVENNSLDLNDFLKLI